MANFDELEAILEIISSLCSFIQGNDVNLASLLLIIWNLLWQHPSFEKIPT